MNEKDKMLSGRLYVSFGKQLVEDREKVKKAINKANCDYTLSPKARQKIIVSVLGSHGKNTYIEAPVRFDYGYNVHVGDNFYANFDCIFLDGNKISIGNNVMVGPRCSFFTASHPIAKRERNALLEYAQQITIGDDVWIGGGTIINPGVTIGSNVVIGAGSVVTKDIPSNVIAYGNPCRPIRQIGEQDDIKWDKIAKGQLKI